MAGQTNGRTSHGLLKSAIRTTQRILAGLGFLVLVVMFTPVDVWWTTHLAGPWNETRGDVLIVLGGSLLKDEIMGESSYSRAVCADRAWKEGGFKTIVLSGGSPGHSAAEALRDFLVALGVPRESIWLETRSRSTRENALFTKPILEGIPGRKVLLTSDSHIYRATRTFQKVGLEVLPRPCPDVQTEAQNPFGGWDVFLALSTETLKIGYYYLRGWI
jgi:uncharacterized SAM-binding protein YcdF (DUF218 family)